MPCFQCRCMWNHFCRNLLVILWQTIISFNIWIWNLSATTSEETSHVDLMRIFVQHLFLTHRLVFSWLWPLLLRISSSPARHPPAPCCWPLDPLGLHPRLLHLVPDALCQMDCKQRGFVQTANQGKGNSGYVFPYILTRSWSIVWTFDMKFVTWANYTFWWDEIALH